MDSEQRCQSCGMPISTGGEYCARCYQAGAFTEPDMTLDRMMMRSIAYMTDELGYSDQKARRETEGLIPFLKRWVR